MSRKTKTGRDTKNTRTCLMSLEDNTNRNACVDGERLLMDCLFANNGFPCMDGDKKKRVFGCPREKDFLHRMNFKAPKKLYEGEPLIRPFLARQPHLALAGAKMCCADVREGWREPVRASENTTGEIRVTSLRYSLLFTPPRHTAQSHATIFPFSSSPSIAVRRQPR
jgi:hypothetical protein